MLEVSLSEVGTMLRLEMGAWSMVKWLRQATIEYALLLPPSSILGGSKRQLRLGSIGTHRRPTFTVFIQMPVTAVHHAVRHAASHAVRHAVSHAVNHADAKTVAANKRE